MLVDTRFDVLVGAAIQQAGTRARSCSAANASANLYSLLQTCMASGIDGYRYLSALLVALPTAKTVEDYEALTPGRG